MLCPHCGKEIVTPAYAEPVNTAGQPALTLFPNNACAAPSLFTTVVNVPNLWLNPAAGAGAEAVRFHFTVGDNDKR